MAVPAIISWNTPAHAYAEKRPDWYWTVGIITLAIAAFCFIFGQIISGIFVVVAAVALVLHASKPPKIILCEINDRGIIVDSVFYPFVSLESFWIPHEDVPPKILVKSRRPLMPLIVIPIAEIDPEEVRSVLLTYIAETEHREPFLKFILEELGF